MQDVEDAAGEREGVQGTGKLRMRMILMGVPTLRIGLLYLAHPLHAHPDERTLGARLRTLDRRAQQ